MSDIVWEKLGEKLPEAVPELAKKYDEMLKDWAPERPGAHVIYGDLLNPYLLSLLEVGEQDDQVRRIFRFIERLAGDPDPRVREVVQVTICERLGDNPKALDAAKSYMGDHTRRLSDEIEKFWGR